jgi:hypothetical protein
LLIKLIQWPTYQLAKKFQPNTRTCKPINVNEGEENILSAFYGSEEGSFFANFHIFFFLFFLSYLPNLAWHCVDVCALYGEGVKVSVKERKKDKDRKRERERKSMCVRDRKRGFRF